MHGVRLVSTPARKTSGRASAGCWERRVGTSEKSMVLQDASVGWGRYMGTGRSAPGLRRPPRDLTPTLLVRLTDQYGRPGPRARRPPPEYRRPTMRSPIEPLAFAVALALAVPAAARAQGAGHDHGGH